MSEEKKQHPLVVLVDNKKKTFWDMRASYMPKNIDINMYFNRALANIFDNAELFKLASASDGASRIIMCISKALQMGLQIGGMIPQAYIVPMPTKEGSKPVLIPTIDGYRFVALSDPPILKDFYISPVYEKEIDGGFSIDMPNGEVKGHFVHFGPDRGELVGVYGILTHLDGRKTAQWMPVADIKRVRDSHSPSWKAVQAGKMDKKNCAWHTDFDMMAIKTAGKRFLEPYVALKEGLQMVLNIDEDAENAIGNSTPDTRPIAKRVDSRLDDIINAEEPVVEMEAEEKPEKEQPKVEGKDGELF